jgi:hypothetical protein
VYRKNIASIFIACLLSSCTLPVMEKESTSTPPGEVEKASTPEFLEIPTDRQSTSEPNMTLVVSEKANLSATPEISPTLPLELTPTITQQPVFENPLYILQPGAPAWLPNFSDPTGACENQTVAGQVFDLNGVPVENLVIEVKGQYDNEDIDQLTLTGVSPIYGPGGYEFLISNQLVATSDSLYLQIFDLTGRKVSHEVYFDTYAACNKNLVLINFSETNIDLLNLYRFLPFIYHNSFLQAMTSTPTP